MGATLSEVSAGSIVRWVRRRVGLDLMRRFVWPVSECPQERRPVKEPVPIKWRCPLIFYSLVATAVPETA